MTRAPGRVFEGTLEKREFARAPDERAERTAVAAPYHSTCVNVSDRGAEREVAAPEYFVRAECSVLDREGVEPDRAAEEAGCCCIYQDLAVRCQVCDRDGGTDQLVTAPCHLVGAGKSSARDANPESLLPIGSVGLVANSEREDHRPAMMILDSKRDSEDREVYPFRTGNQVSFERLDLLGEPCPVRSVFWDADRSMKGNHGCLPKLLRLVPITGTHRFMLIERVAAVATETFVVPDSGPAGRTALDESGPTVFAEPSV